MTTPPPGYRFAPRATFFAPGRRITIASTECYGCGWRKGKHGPKDECPTRTITKKEGVA